MNLVLAARVEVVDETNEDGETSIHKVRRRALGDKRALGHEFQRCGRRIRRADPSRIRCGPTDGSLTAVGGLVPFGMFLDCIGLPGKLRRWFGHIKDGDGVVYPMDAQLRLLLDANVVGEGHVFGLEALGADPLRHSPCSAFSTPISWLCRCE